MLQFQILRNLPSIYHFKDHDRDAAEIVNIAESHIPENVLHLKLQFKGLENEKIKNKK